MGIREIRQQEAVDSYSGNYHSLILAAPRMGKTKVAIDIFRKLGIKKALICIPRLDIIESWKNDVEKWNWDGELIFTTHRSMGNAKDKGDIVVVD